MKPIGIHHMSALELAPVEFIHAAAEAGFQHVSLFGQGDPNSFPMVTADNKAAVKKALRDTGLKVGNVDPFMILPNTTFSDFIPGLELAAEIGARAASIPILDTDEQHVIDVISQMCEKAISLDLKLAIEFMPLAPYCRTIKEALQLIDKIGHDNIGISLDILHLIRSGGTPDDIGSVAPRFITAAQLCDSLDGSATSDYAGEAMSSRLAPGEGVFPTADFIHALPSGIPLELEVPQTSEIPAAERIKHFMEATKRFL